MPAMVPVNLSVEDVRAAAGVPAGTDTPTAPDVSDLDNWSQEAYSLSVSTASDLGFPVGNITASFKREALMSGRRAGRTWSAESTRTGSGSPCGPSWSYPTSRAAER
jgi:hypothetical protein